jgi:curved DNA-binding protein CbpA
MSKTNFNESPKQKTKKARKNENMIDFYQVLGIEDKTVSINEIKKKYIKLAVKYHPDKNVDKDPALFELIQRAWEALGTEEKRKNYDNIFANVDKIKKSDHVHLKQSYDTYVELDKTDPKSEATARIDFKSGFEEMNRKHNFDPKKLREEIDNPLKQDDSKNRLTDLMQTREQDEIEFTQNKIFDEKNFNVSKFNAAFDMYKDSNKHADKANQIVQQGGPSAFNAAASNDFTNGFTSIGAFDNTYDDNNFEGNGTYGSINFGSENKLNIDKIRNIADVDYTNNHDKKDSNYKSDYEAKLKERLRETEELDTIKVTDFKNDPKDSFMFTHEVGSVGGLDWNNDDNEDLVDACNKLIELESNKSSKTK